MTRDINKITNTAPPTPPGTTRQHNFALALTAQKEQMINALNRQIAPQIAENLFGPVFQKLTEATEKNPEQIQRNLRVAKILINWELSIDTIAAALLLGITDSTTKNNAINQVLANNKELHALTSRLNNKDQIANFQDLFFFKAKNVESLLLICAEDLVDMPLHVPESDRNTPPFKVKRALYVTSWILVFFSNEIQGGELADFAFPWCEPKAHAAAHEHLKSLSADITSKEARLAKLKNIADDLDKLLSQLNIGHKIIYRCKAKVSTHQKTATGKPAIDINGIRIITDARDDCWRALDAIRTALKQKNWTEDLTKFDDYLGQRKKPNGYESLHAIFTKENFTLEVQIRDRDMDAVAETGSACRASYKLGLPFATPRAQPWQAIASSRFNQKKNSLQGTVVAYDEQGALHRLISTDNRPPTVLDFAFHLDADSGLCAVGGTKNRQHCALSSSVQPGDTIKIITGAIINQATAGERINQARTSLAQTILAAFAKKPGLITNCQQANQQNSIAKGRKIFEKEIEATKQQLISQLPRNFSVASSQLVFPLRKLAQTMGFTSKENLYLALALMEQTEQKTVLEKISGQIKTSNLFLMGTTQKTKDVQLEFVYFNDPQTTLNILAAIQQVGGSIKSLSIEPAGKQNSLMRVLAAGPISPIIEALKKSELQSFFGQNYSPRNASLTLEVKTLVCGKHAIANVLQKIISFGGLIQRADFPPLQGLPFNKEMLKGVTDKDAIYAILQKSGFITKKERTSLKFPIDDLDAFSLTCQSGEESISASLEQDLTIAFYILDGQIKGTSNTAYEITFKLPEGKERKKIIGAMEKYFENLRWVKLAKGTQT